MGIRQALTRVLMDWLPAEDQTRMVADFIAWLYADLPPGEQQEKIERLGPRVIEMIREGRFGLSVLIFHHLLRLPPLRWLDRWAARVEAAAAGQRARSAAGCRPTAYRR